MTNKTGRKKTRENNMNILHVQHIQFCTHFVFSFNVRIRKEIMKEADKDEKKKTICRIKKIE